MKISGTSNTLSNPARAKQIAYAAIGIFFLTLSLACAPTSRIGADISPVVLPLQFSRQGNVPSTIWWQDLNDQSLQTLIERALAQNLSLKAAEERLLQAEALARQAGAELSPSLDGKGSMSKGRSRSDGTTSTTSSLLLGLAASYEIDLWGRLQGAEDAAIFEARASGEDRSSAALSLAAQVANIWYGLAASYAQLELLEQQQNVNRMALQLIRLRFNAGQIGIADILQQQQLIESKTGELAQQRATAKVLEHQLAILTGVSPGMLDLPGTPRLVELPPLPATGVPADLLINRPDIRSRYLALLAADKKLAAAIADRYPRLSIGGDLNTSGSSSRDLFDNWLASLAANIVSPLLDGGSRKASAERSSAALQEKIHAYGESLLNAVAEVEDALVEEEQQRIQLDSLEIQLDLATKTLMSIQERYKQGTEDYQRVLAAQLSQQGLQRSLITGRRQRISYRIDLYRALGGKVPESGEDYQPRNTSHIPSNQRHTL